MIKLRNIGPDLSLYKPEGDANALPVVAGAVVEFKAELIEEIDDAYILGDPSTVDEKGNPVLDPEARAYPKANWELVKATSPAKADKIKDGE